MSDSIYIFCLGHIFLQKIEESIISSRKKKLDRWGKNRPHGIAIKKGQYDPGREPPEP
jgi:hypothetical protein